MKGFDGRDGLRRASSYLPELESLRGWAILSVVAFHYFGILTHGKMGAGPGAPFWMKLMSAGNTGVTLFFVLSGFLLARPFLENLRRGRPTSIRRFYVARMLRILPLFYLVVLLAWALTRSPHAPRAFLFIRIGFDAFPFSVPWWTLTLEVQFYLLLPWAMLLLQRAWTRWLLAAIMAAWAVAQLYFVHTPGWANWTNTWQNTLFDRGFAFVVGALAARFYLSAVFQRFAGSRAAVALTAAGSVTALLLLFRFYADQGQIDALLQLPLFHDYEALSWTTLLLSAVAARDAWKVLLINPVADHFGRISYSLYLAHVPVQVYLLKRLADSGDNVFRPRNVFLIVASFGVAWLTSVLMYQLIERPFLRLKAHLPVQAAGDHGSTTAAAPAAPGGLAPRAQDRR